MNFIKKYFNFIVAGAILILIYRIINNWDNVIKFFHNLFEVFSPVIAGAAIAFFLNRPVGKFQKHIDKINNKYTKKHSKGLSVLLVYMIIVLIISIIVKFIAPKIYSNLVDLISHMPEYYKVISDFVKSNEYLSSFNIISELTHKLTSTINIENLNKYIGVISGIANSFISFFLSVVISIYIILEKEAMFKFFATLREKFFKSERSQNFFGYIRKISDLFYRYFCGLALDAVIIGTIAAIIFACFKIPYAVLLGLLVAVGNMIPFFGPIVAAVVVYIISAITFGPFNAIWVLVFQLVLGQLDSNLVQPRILSNSTGISPLLVLISVTVFGELFGVLGMILGVPVCATAKMIIVDYIDNGKLDRSCE